MAERRRRQRLPEAPEFLPQAVPEIGHGLSDDLRMRLLCGFGHRPWPHYLGYTTLDEIRAHGRVLTPRRCGRFRDQEDGSEPFEFRDKMRRFTATPRERMAKAGRLDAAIGANVKELGHGG